EITDATGTIQTLNVSLTTKAVDLTLNGFAELVTFNATGSTGGITVDLSTNADLEAASFGSGADDITVALNDTDQVVNAGAGRDTVTVTGACAAVDGTLTITLGAGADLLEIGALANVGGDTSATFEDNLVSITDFRIAQNDVLNLDGTVASGWATQGL